MTSPAVRASITTRRGSLLSSLSSVRTQSNAPSVQSADPASDSCRRNGELECGAALWWLHVRYSECTSDECWQKNPARWSYGGMNHRLALPWDPFLSRLVFCWISQTWKVLSYAEMFISVFIVFLLLLCTQTHKMIVIMKNVLFYNFGHRWIEYLLVTFNT